MSLMKFRNFFSLNLPPLLFYHLKIAFGSLVVTMFFSFMWRGRLITEDFWFVFFIVAVQLEIFMKVAQRIFKPDRLKTDGSYRSRIIRKLIKFYLLVLVIAFAILLTVIIINIVLFDQRLTDVVGYFVERELKFFLFSWLIGISIGSVFFFYAEWSDALKREQKLREEKLIFQYETLKNQVNPHFLFNSLNTLSSLVAEDAELAEIFILKLASIYRYILENKDTEFISLSREVEFVKNYFYLQKIRDQAKIDLEAPDRTETDRFEIIPISIQLLVENALKHNAVSRENPLKISISIEQEYVVVTNKLQPKSQLSGSSKIGLKNLSERVRLLMNKELIVHSTGNEYIVKIPLKAR